MNLNDLRTFTPREPGQPVKARDLLPLLQAHPDADIDIEPQDYDVTGRIESVEYVQYPREGTDAIVVRIS